ncbi:MAG: ABC transporter permease [Nitrospira sp.]|nr:ABC transporter permease [Nitrospira sp.]HBP87492.1 ABC transporter [Nitrospiraceae bacterium]HNP27710.1 ABC transporter permease [Nitrospirales bacterium]
MSLGRILALLSRHMYLYKRSFARLLEIFYWPFLDLVVWGFITVYLEKVGMPVHGAVTFFLGALILWDVLFRAQQGIAVSFLEEMWARNLMNLFASPLTVGEYLVATMTMSVLKVTAVGGLMMLFAWVFYSYDILLMGISLLPFVLNLVVSGWIIGVLTTSIIMRFGQQAEVLAWGMVFLFQPISCVFYPIDVLPPVLQSIAWMVPPAHIFEGMRAVLTTGMVPVTHLLWSTGLNFGFLVIIVALFYHTFNVCKDRGMLVRVGE